MKTTRLVFAALAAAVLGIATVFAADPTGTWKWSMQGRNGNAREVAAKLRIEDGHLTGTVTGWRGAEQPITNGAVKDDMVSFSVVSTFRERTFEVKYQGRIEGDTITGTIQLPARGEREGRKVDWKATRSK